MGLADLKLNAGGIILGIVGLAAGIAVGFGLKQESKTIAAIAVGALILGALTGNLAWSAIRRR